MLKEGLTPRQARKHLEILYSWAEFWRYAFDNERADRTQQDIVRHKEHYGL